MPEAPTCIQKAELLKIFGESDQKLRDNIGKIKEKDGAAAISVIAAKLKARIMTILQGASHEIISCDERDIIIDEVNKAVLEALQGVFDVKNVPGDRKMKVMGDIMNVQKDLSLKFIPAILSSKNFIESVPVADLSTGEAVYLALEFMNENPHKRESGAFIVARLDKVAQDLNINFHDGKTTRDSQFVFNAYLNYRLEACKKMAIQNGVSDNDQVFIKLENFCRFQWEFMITTIKKEQDGTLKPDEKTSSWVFYEILKTEQSISCLPQKIDQ